MTCELRQWRGLDVPERMVRVRQLQILPRGK